MLSLSIFTDAWVLFWFSLRIQIYGCLLTRTVDVEAHFIKYNISSLDNPSCFLIKQSISL